MSKPKSVYLVALFLCWISAMSERNYAQTNNPLADLIGGNVRWDSRAQRIDIAKSLLSSFSQLDDAISYLSPEQLNWLQSERAAMKAKNLSDEQIKKRLINYDLSTERQIEVARYRITNIIVPLQIITGERAIPLGIEMAHWTDVAIHLLDNDAFDKIARLHQKGIISVPSEYSFSSALASGDWPRHYARGIIENIVRPYLGKTSRQN